MTTSWQHEAHCHSVGSYFFFAPDNEQPRAKTAREHAALSICATCPVISPCRQHALRAGERHGIWGGTTESQRASHGHPSVLQAHTKPPEDVSEVMQVLIVEFIEK